MIDFLLMVGGALFAMIVSGIINYGKSKWVGLTDEERNHARQNVTYSQLAMTISEWADAVQIETEQRLMEKNK